MKRLFKYISILAAAATTPLSCAPNNLVESADDGNRIELAISLPGLETKAPGEDRFNENKIDNIYYFFYPEGATDSAPVLSGSFAGSETQSISVSQAKINELFPGGKNRCRIFLVANPPADVATDLRNSAAATYDHVRSCVLTTDLNGVQDSFVMTGDALVDLINRNPSPGNPVASANVELRRLASKITIKAIVKKTHVDSNVPDVIWTSQADGLKAYFVNGMNKTNLAGDFSMFSDNDVAENRFESLPVSFTRTDYDLENDLATFTIPIYSYPMVWDFEDEREPYLLFELPLQSSKNNKYQLCYYKFMLSEKEMTGNHWYDITVHLNVMGSFFRNEPMQQFLRNDYLVIDWHDAYGSSIDERDENVEADVKAPRYLVFNQNEYIIYDQDELDIPFVSSHKLATTAGYIDASSVSIARKNDYSTSNTTNYIQYSGDKGQLFQVNGSVISFRHRLNNDIDDVNFDCTPWTFEVRVKHEDNDNYYQVLRIIQYPSVYIETETNSAGGDNTGGFSVGNVWVNGTTSNASNSVKYTNYGGAFRADPPGQSNSSIDFTIFSIGRLGDHMPYTIGDPRKIEVDNYNAWDPASAMAPGLDSNGDPSGNRTISYYYPTDDSPEYRSFIAPKLRLSTGNANMGGAGINPDVPYDKVKKRCATYMEDGYPAGRWRLPTEAEVRFMISLSDRFIPSVFYYSNSPKYYWFAGGYLVLSMKNSTQRNDPEFHFDTSRTAYTSTRCVYDEWYWEIVDQKIGNDHSEKKFYWGDMSREAVDALFNN